ncbi:hypothetical protein H8959_009522, partial [Pygathrix nigripes]
LCVCVFDFVRHFLLTRPLKMSSGQENKSSRSRRSCSPLVSPLPSRDPLEAPGKLSSRPPLARTWAGQGRWSAQSLRKRGTAHAPQRGGSTDEGSRDSRAPPSPSELLLSRSI